MITKAEATLRSRTDIGVDVADMVKQYLTYDVAALIHQTEHIEREVDSIPQYSAITDDLLHRLTSTVKEIKDCLQHT